MEYPDPCYFDYSASEPPYRDALEAGVSASLQFPANPSSSHAAGKAAARRLLELKIRFCELMGSTEGHLLLCGSATEANNTLIEGHLKQFPEGRIRIAENVHDSIWYATGHHSESTSVIPLTQLVSIHGDEIRDLVVEGTTLLCINHVCNETGRIHELEAIAEWCQLRGIRLLVDGSQAVGHVPVNLEQLPCDYYTWSAHKFGGPRGVGGIVIRDREFAPLLSGGKQEWELRAGTENVAGLASAIRALEISLDQISEHAVSLNELKNKLLNELKDRKVEFLQNAPAESRPGFLSLSFPGKRGNEIVAALSVEGYRTATGSACHDSRSVASRIILATGRSESEAAGTVRISMGRGNTAEAVEDLATAFARFTGRAL